MRPSPIEQWIDIARAGVRTNARPGSTKTSKPMIRQIIAATAILSHGCNTRPVNVRTVDPRLDSIRSTASAIKAASSILMTGVVVMAWAMHRQLLVVEWAVGFLILRRIVRGFDLQISGRCLCV
jgi:hypothetical protein